MSDMKNQFIVNTIKKEKNKITYDYKIKGEWRRYFNPIEKFEAEYDIDIDMVPDSVLILPLLGNILVMASIFNAEIFVESIDKEFIDAVPDILMGYRNMYPRITFIIDGIIRTNKIIKTLISKSDKKILFFSGGVDAYSSLINHEKERLNLVSIWGADVPVDNETAWNLVCKSNEEIALKHNLLFSAIKANLHTFIKEYELDQWSKKNAGDNWWYCFQHSVGMLMLSAPLAYIQGIETIYFASTYSIKDKKGYALASDPCIDNNVRFFGCSVIHDGFEFSRQDKVHRICKYSSRNKQIKLRVCFKSKDGNNCCVCRKCLLTIFQILLENENPENYGFHYDKVMYIKLLVAGMQELAHDHPFDFKSLFSDMQIKFREKYNLENVPVELKPFYLLSIDEFIAFMQAPNNLADFWEKQVQDLHKWIGELEKGKYWLENQVKYKDIRIKELEDWIKELEKGKKWLEEQVRCKSERIKELESIHT